MLVSQDVARFACRDLSNPFLRYRELLSPYRVARSTGLSDAAWEEIVGRLESTLADVDGAGFHVTPMTPQPALAQALGRHTSEAGRNPSAGQSEPVPVQTSETSHGPAAARHSVPALTKESTGHWN